MSRPTNDAIWLNSTEVCRIEDLAERSGLSIEEIADLVDTGVIAPLEEENQAHYFLIRHVLTVKVARRLRDDFQLDCHGISLALTLLRRIDDLEARLAAAEAMQLCLDVQESSQ